ncbi:MAG: T9SS type A sorting domain-containing protein, partial [Flavobacteriales bacterium]
SDEREPVQWNSIKTGGGFASNPNFFVVDKSTDIANGVGGTYSTKIETKEYIFNIKVNGVLTNGRVEAPALSAASGYNRTKPDDSDFSTEFVDFPDTLVVWVKYAPQGGDNGRFQCILHSIVGDGLSAGTMGSLPETGDNQGDNTGQTIANAETNLTSTNGEWQRVSVPFTYANANAPEYILFTASSSAVPGGGADGSVMYVDNIALIYNVTPVLGSATVDVSAVNSAALNVDYSTGGTPVAATDFVVELSDENGSFAAPVVIGTETATTATSGSIACTVPAGTMAGTGYMVRVTNASEYYAPIEVPLTVTNLTVGIAGVSNNNIRVYAANGNVSIDLTASGVENAAYEVISLTGQRVATGALNAGILNSISNLNTGIYAVRIIHAEGMFTSKVLVN